MILFFKTPSQHVIAAEVDHSFSPEEISKLCWLFGEATPASESDLQGRFVGPRREMVTPWSTNAVEITQNMGLAGISRIEAFIPMKDGDEPDPMLQRLYKKDVQGGYPFMGTEWRKWHFKRVTLTETLRQRDADFVDALEKCRVGDVSGVRWIETHAARRPKGNPIILCGTNAKASEENGSRLGEIKAPATGYRGSVWGDVKQQDMPTDMKIRLKAGARVMSVVNDPEGLYMNGSLGTVRECRPHSVIVAFDGGREVEVSRHVWTVMKPVLEDGRIRMETVGEFTQIPLKLAWAITIHKSQGQTFDSAIIHPYCWDYGQLYTALSRLTSVEGMTLACRVQARYLKASPDVIEFERRTAGTKADAPLATDGAT